MWGRFVPNHYPLITLGESGDFLFLEDTSIYGETMTSNIKTFEAGWAGLDAGTSTLVQFKVLGLLSTIR